MPPILTAEDVVKRIAAECACIDDRGAVGIRLKPAVTIVRQYGEQFRAVPRRKQGRGAPKPPSLLGSPLRYINSFPRRVDCAVVNAGDGSHEHPTQALLDALTIPRRKGRLGGLAMVICGDILHSRVARSSIALLNTMGARVRVLAPRTLLPAEIERLGVEVFHDMAQGLADVDIVMMLHLQSERMHGSFVPSTREYFHFFGLDYDKLRAAKPDGRAARSPVTGYGCCCRFYRVVHRRLPEPSVRQRGHYFDTLVN
jgi:hypothetical protein